MIKQSILEILFVALVIFAAIQVVKYLSPEPKNYVQAPIVITDESITFGTSRVECDTLHLWIWNSILNKFEKIEVEPFQIYEFPRQWASHR